MPSGLPATGVSWLAATSGRRPGAKSERLWGSQLRSASRQLQRTPRQLHELSKANMAVALGRFAVKTLFDAQHSLFSCRESQQLIGTMERRKFLEVTVRRNMECCVGIASSAFPSYAHAVLNLPSVDLGRSPSAMSCWSMSFLGVPMSTLHTAHSSPIERLLPHALQKSSTVGFLPVGSCVAASLGPICFAPRERQGNSSHRVATSRMPPIVHLGNPPRPFRTAKTLVALRPCLRFDEVSLSQRRSSRWRIMRMGTKL